MEKFMYLISEINSGDGFRYTKPMAVAGSFEQALACRDYLNNYDKIMEYEKKKYEIISIKVFDKDKGYML